MSLWQETEQLKLEWQQRHYSWVPWALFFVLLRLKQNHYMQINVMETKHAIVVSVETLSVLFIR